MARPKTEAAHYVMVTFRLPPDLLAKVRRLIGSSGVPLNTKLVHMVQAQTETEEKAIYSERNHNLVSSRND